MRASIIRLRFTLGFCFLFLISSIKGFPSRLNGKNEVKNCLKVRSVESSNGKTMFASEDNSCGDLSNLEATIFTVQESLPILIGRCPFKTIQILTSLAAELGRAKMSNGKINQSYVTPNFPTSFKLPDTIFTSNEFFRTLLILILEKISQLSSTLISQGQSSRSDENNCPQTSIQSSKIIFDFYTHGNKNLAYTRSANASDLLKSVDTAVFFSSANVSLVLSTTNGKISTGLAIYLKNITGTLKISGLSTKIANLAEFITDVENLKGLISSTVSDIVDSYLTPHYSSMVKTKTIYFSPENTCWLSSSSIIEFLNSQSSSFLCQKINKAINAGPTQEMNENHSFLISRIFFSHAGKDMNYTSFFFLKSENYSTATEKFSFRIKLFIGCIHIHKTRKTLNQASKTTPATLIFGKSCISQKFSFNIALISQNLSTSSTLKSDTVVSCSGLIEIGESLSESGKIDKVFFSHTLSLGSVLLDKATELKNSLLRTMIPEICSKHFAGNLTVLNLTFFFEPTTNLDDFHLTTTHQNFRDSNQPNLSNSTYLLPFIEFKENFLSWNLFCSSASFNLTQKIFFSNSDFMIYNSRISTNTLESHKAAHTSVSKKDTISIMRPGMMANSEVGYNESAVKFKFHSTSRIFECSLPTSIPKDYNLIG